MAPNMLWFENNGARIDMKSFLETKYFSGKFGRLQAKLLRTPKNLPAPTPTGLRAFVYYFIQSGFVGYFQKFYSFVL